MLDRTLTQKRVNQPRLPVCFRVIRAATMTAADLAPNRRVSDASFAGLPKVKALGATVEVE